MARKLTKNVNFYGDLYLAGSTPPKDVADRITNPNAWDGDDDTEDKGYAGLSPDELKAEVEKRNADREEGARIEIKGTGANGNVKKGDLVAALEADDATASESE